MSELAGGKLDPALTQNSNLDLVPNILIPRPALDHSQAPTQ